MTESHLYVYGVMRAEDAPSLAFKPVSAPGVDPLIVPCGAHQVVASPIEVEEVLPARRNLLAHAKALETMMAAGPVLPMRFGLVSPNAAAIQATVERATDILAAGLDDLEGCAEYGVRVSWERAAMMRAVVDRNPALKRAYDSLSGKSETATHYQRVELGRQVEAAISELRVEEAAICRKAVAAASRRIEEQEPEDELGILKVDCLVADDQAEALGAALEALSATRGDAVQIKLVGPAPAYNFVAVALDWAEAA